MARYPKNQKDVAYYVPGRKRQVAGSTKSTSDFLALVHEEYPMATVAELRGIVTDKRRFLTNPEAVDVLDAHIRTGHGGLIPDWR